MHKWKSWIGAFAAVVLLTVSSCSSWTPEQREYTAVGATGGALIGGGAGCAIGLESDEDDAQTVGLGCGIGVLTGAVVGGIVGYLLAPKPVEPKGAVFIPALGI